MASGDSFVHLHVHTDYSMLDGAARIDDLLEEAVRQGMPAIAMTDHGNMFGAYEFWKHAGGHGIKPIIGIEAYLTPGTHRSDKSRVRWGTAEQKDDDVSAGGAYTHMTMLAETTEGMHNLFRMSSLASIEGNYSKWARMDRELLERYSKGVIATTGCPSGEVQTRLRLGQYAEAKRAAGELQEIFGKGNFFAEIMDHGLSIERRTQSDLLRIASELGIPLVGTNDLHYVHSHDAGAQEALLCINSGSTLDDPNRFRFDGDGYYLKSAAEMRHVFRDHPEAIDSTLLIAERVSVEFVEGEGLYMPRFPVPEGETEASWFRAEVEAGLRRRYPDGISDAVRARAEYELEVIVSKGYAGYYLVVADFINWAKDHGVRVGPGRGSGAGSMAAYALRITDLDPLEHGLIFERFLNPERMSMPDFDVDFDDRRRGDVIRYVTEKYGDERVAQIVTYGTIKAKQALKDAARVLGMPYSIGDQLTKAMPDAVQGNDISLRDVFDPKADRYKEAGDLRTLVETDPTAKQVFDTALGLEGLKRQWGVHAAGVIMSSEPLIDLIPIMKREQDGQIVTQFEYYAAEPLGLVKMDFLGLRNLTVLSDALDNIRANRGVELDLESLPLDDPGVYELLATGNTLGIFQFDSGGYQSLCRLMRPTEFADIVALGALFRPGPMGTDSHTNYAKRKNGQQAVDYIHPELAEALRPILDETYGLTVYQEHVMEIARQLAGYTMGQADNLRKAMGKKKPEVLAKEFVPFRDGMRGNGFSDAAIQTLWDVLVPFSAYAFNKAHAAAYGVISYWTTYLKAHYPAEYMAALLTSTGENRDRLAVYLNECRRMGIRVLPPDVNESIGFFAAVGDDIRFGMGAVRNVGFGVVDQIVAARTEGGRFASFHDFVRRLPLTAINKRMIESLIKAGAFDSMGATRRALVEIHEDVVDGAVGLKRNEAQGMVGFDFDSLWDEPEQVVDVVPDRPEWTKKDKLAFEREMLGLYVSDHPLAGLEEQLARLASVSIADVRAGERVKEGEQVIVAGLITSAQPRIARSSGNPYGVIELEDFGGSIQVMVMGKTYQEFWPAVTPDAIAVVKGRVQYRDDVAGLSAQVITIPEIALAAAADAGPMTLSIAEARATAEIVQRLAEVLARHPGETEVRLQLLREGRASVFELGHRVRRDPALTAELKTLLGLGAVA